MRKALVALVGTVVVGVLAFSTPAAAKQLAFQGDSEGSPIAMTMTGKSFKKPKRVTAFSIIPVGDCAYTGPNPLILPIPQSTNGRGIVIKRNPRGHGDEFEWSYEAGGIIYEVQGRQNLKDARKWFGRLFLYFATPPGRDCASD